MCLVEVEKSPKPVASCAMPAMPNMNIKVNKLLRSVLWLINQFMRWLRKVQAAAHPTKHSHLLAVTG